MKLEHALTVAERREKWTYYTAIITGILAMVLMFVGGTRIVGDFDPWDRNATVLSVTLGVIYCICAALCPLAIASYYSRFRPAVRNVKEQLREASIQSLHDEIADLRKQVEALLKARDGK